MTQPRSPRPPFEALLAIALVSFSILAAEVALTRIFSVLFRAPYVFLIVSGAIGGLGLGGLLVQRLRVAEERLRVWIVGLSVVLALALAAPVLLLFALPSGRELVAQAETAVVVALPMATFCVAGMLLSLIFRQYAESGGFLYFVDLAAAALAAPASVLLLDLLGGIGTPLLLAAAVAAAGLALALRIGRGGWTIAAGAVLALLAGVFGSNLALGWITLPTLKAPAAAVNDPTHPWHLIAKPLYEELGSPFSSSRIVKTDWTSIARTDVVHDPGQDLYYIYTDGDVPTQMETWDGNWESVRETYGTFIGNLAYRVLDRAPERVMAIGSGGGLDVLLARAAGAKEIDAVEINPSIPRIVSDPRFANTYARAYKEPGVRLVVDEGRSHLHRSGRSDAIYFACAKTATTQTGGVALLDNHLYTVEAFRDYWRHLSDDGLLALVVQEGFLIDRLLITALAALRQEGVAPAEAGAHLATARVSDEKFGYGPYRYTLLMRRRPWNAAEAEELARKIGQNTLTPLYVPHLKPQGAAGAAFRPEASLGEIQQSLEGQYRTGTGPQITLGPVTDDRPFYVDVARGLHPTLQGLLQGAMVATVVVFLAVLVLAFAGARKGERVPVPTLAAGLVYFSMLGAGFMFVELALMQRFILLLGFPTRSLTVTLFALLVSCALGSRASQQGTPEDAGRRLRPALAALVALLVLYRVALPPFVTLLLPTPLAVRVVATVLLLFPAGFLMGMAFPTALRGLSENAQRLVPSFWSVNGVTSILGSVATMALAKFIGYGGVLVVGAVCYLVARVVFPLLTTPDSAIGPELAPKLAPELAEHGTSEA